jgi:hypothetical protein
MLFPGLCRQAQEVRNSKHVPFFANPGFFPSPPKPYQLPIYAKAISRDFVTLNPRPTSRAHSVDPRVLQFVDDRAIESDSETLDTEGSSTSACSG